MADGDNIVNFRAGASAKPEPTKTLATSEAWPSPAPTESELHRQIAATSSQISEAIRHMKHLAAKLATPPPGDFFEHAGQDALKYAALGDIFVAAANTSANIERIDARMAAALALVPEPNGAA